MKYRELYMRAVEIMPNAYAPFSKFKVGAALLTTTGEIFTGVNVENSSFGATICAERTAATKAVSEGFKEFEAIAIASSEGAAWPCGICRQFLYEFSPNMKIVSGPDGYNLTIRELTDLLPEGFRL